MILPVASEALRTTREVHVGGAGYVASVCLLIVSKRDKAKAPTLTGRGFFVPSPMRYPPPFYYARRTLRRQQARNRHRLATAVAVFLLVQAVVWTWWPG